MRPAVTSALVWLNRAWRAVGVALLVLVAVEGMYRASQALRSRSAPQPTGQALRDHPYANQPWFKGWYAQPVVRAGTVYDPYRTSHKAPARTPYINIDSAGRRVTVQPSGASSARRVFLLGGSTMWGYTARDSFTIASAVAALLRARGLTDVEVVNLAQPGYNATQEVITLMLALRDGEIPAAAVFLTTHKDVYAAFQNGKPGGITSQRQYAAQFEARTPGLGDDLKALARHTALGARMAPVEHVESYSSHEPSAGLCDAVSRQYLQLGRITGGMARQYGFPFLFLRQPMLATSHKPLSPWERKLPRPRFEATYLRCVSAIDSTMRAFPGGEYHSLATLFDTDTSTVFIDEYGYLTEAAGQAVARQIVELVEPALRSAKPAPLR